MLMHASLFPGFYNVLLTPWGAQYKRHCILLILYFQGQLIENMMMLAHSIILIAAVSSTATLQADAYAKE